MTSSTAIRPRDLREVDTVAVEMKDGDQYDATVLKNTPKSGRVRLAPFAPGGATGDETPQPRTVPYSQIANIELIGRQTNGQPGDDEQAYRREQALVARAVELGLDIDPTNYDEVALRGDLGFIDHHAAVLDRARIAPSEVGEFTSEQRKRVESATEGAKDGLVGKALAEWIRTGDSGSKRAKAERQAKAATREPRGLREGSTMWAVLEVLRKARKPLTAQEVAEKIISGKMAPGLKGKTPEATIAAAMNVAVKRGQHGIVRPTPGHFELDRSK